MSTRLPKTRSSANPVHLPGGGSEASVAVGLYECWCYFRSGEITEQQNGSWNLAYLHLDSQHLLVADKRKDSEKTWKLVIPFSGTKIEPLEHSDRPFTLQVTVSSPREIRHLFAFSERSVLFHWMRSLAPFVHPIAACSECRESKEIEPVFGQPLKQVIQRDGSQIPYVIETCIEFLQANNAHEEEGIFRRSGSKQQVLAIKEQFDKNERIDLIDCGDPHVIAGVVKLFLMELPEPLIPYQLFDSFLSVLKFEAHEQVAAIGSLVAQLTVESQWLLSYIMNYLMFINRFLEQNLMTFDNLAIVFAPSILRKKDASPQEEVMLMPLCKQVTSVLFSNYYNLSLKCSIAEEVRKLQQEDAEEESIARGILSVPQFDLIQAQFIRTEGQSGSFPHYLQCGDTEGNKLVVGTEVGMAMLRVHATSTDDKITKMSDKKIEHQWLVLEKKLFHKLSVIDELSLTLAIAGTNSRLGAFRFTKDGYKYEKLANTKGCHDFSYCWKEGKLHVVAAVKTSLLLFVLTKYEDSGSFQFSLKKEFYTPAPCCLLRFYPTSILLGFRELSEFHILGVESSQIDQLCGSQSDRNPRDVLFLEAWDEYFVCFNDVGIFLDAKTFLQSRTTMVHFEEEPHRLVPVFPHYLLAVGDQSVTVIRITDATIVQRLEISPFVENTATLKKTPLTTSADSGYMVLQEGNMVKLWKKRWFVLNGGVLFYFSDEKSNDMLGAIMLKNASIKDGGKIIRRKFSLCIISEGKRIFVACESQEEADSWKSKIQKSIGSVDKRMSVFPKRTMSLESDSAADVPDAKTLKSWTVDDVSAWLRSVDLADLIPSFREHQVAGEVLSHFEKDDAKKLNVSIGKRLILLKRIELLKQEAEGKVAPEPDDDDDPISPVNALRKGSMVSVKSVMDFRGRSYRVRLLTSKNYVFVTCNRPGISEVFQILHAQTAAD